MQRIHLHHLHSIWQLLAPASISTPAGERSSASHAVQDSLPPCDSLTSPVHTHTHRQTHTNTDTQTHTQTHTHIHTHLHIEVSDLLHKGKHDELLHSPT